MKIFGLQINRVEKRALSGVASYSGGWRRILEPFSGAWQRNISEDHGTLLCYPTLYACIMRIASDVGKLPFMLMEQATSGIWSIVRNSAYSPVLSKPNHYQTAQQFREAWLLSKLIQGNTYALKKRDLRGVVTALYILDPTRVQPMVSDGGQVFYRLYTDNLNKIREGSDLDLMIPASEIIHDRCVTLHHPLIGIPPLCAAYWPALKNLKILKASTEFFGNNAQPGGILTAPAGMSEADAKDLKTYWDENYTGANSGKVAVIGADMKFVSFAMKSADSQLVEQMRYSDEQICQPFGIPPFKIGIGAVPAGLGVDGINQLYYSDALQTHIEAMEALLDEGLGIEKPKGVELDLEPLLRMDVGKQATVEAQLVGAKIKTPDEGRRRFNLPAIAGGDTLWGQHQDYPLGMLAGRNDLNPIVAPSNPNPEDDAEDDPVPDQTDKALALLFRRSPESFANA